MKLNEKHWRIAAIILFILLVGQTAGFVYLYNVGTESYETESECVNVCDSMQSDSYFFDIHTEECVCIKDGDYIWQNVLS